MMLWKQCTQEAIVISSRITMPTTRPWVSPGHGYFLQSTSRTKQLTIFFTSRYSCGQTLFRPFENREKEEQGILPTGPKMFFFQKRDPMRTKGYLKLALCETSVDMSGLHIVCPLVTQEGCQGKACLFSMQSDPQLPQEGCQGKTCLSSRQSVPWLP